jgi:hypothetical protein
VRLDQLLKGEFHPGARSKKAPPKKPTNAVAAVEVAKKGARKKPAEPAPKIPKPKVHDNPKAKASDRKAPPPPKAGKGGKNEKKTAARSR